MIYPMDYTTFEDFERQIRSEPTDTEVVNDYDVIRKYIASASRYFSNENITNRVFVPYDFTLEVEATGKNFDHTGRFMWLPDDCFAISTFNGVSGTAISSSLYRFRYQYSQTHYQVELHPNAKSTGINSLGFVDRYEITGTWGYHRNYDDAWVSSTTLDGGINATTTTVRVDSVANLERLHYLKIGTEYMQITGAIPTGSPLDLTVKRGVNGSTATTHDDEDVVSYWEIEYDVQLAVTRLATALYRSRHNGGSTLRFNDGTIVVEGNDKTTIEIASYLKKPKRIRKA